MDILNLVSQRRVWAAIVGGMACFLSIAKTQYQIDVPVLTDLFTALGGALASLITAGLALWSYLKPKKANE